jgi:hypothetical protein
VTLTVNTFVYGFWIIGALLAIVVIPLFALKAWRSGSDQALLWRGVKVMASALGLVGLFLLLLNFEQVVRSSVVDDSKEYALTTFLEAKFIITKETSVACSKDMANQQARLTCGDFQNIDNQISFIKLRDDMGFGQLTNWQNNPVLDPVIRQLNTYLANIDQTRRAFRAPRTFSFESRFGITLISTLLVILAIAGSLSESIFQFRQTLDQEQARQRK